MPTGHVDKAKLRSIVSTAAAIALALFAGSFFACANVVWNPGYYGEFGMILADDSSSVADVVPGSPAYRAGIRPGDKVDRPQEMRARLLLSSPWRIAPRPGERMTISTLRGKQHTTLALQARPLVPLSVSEKVFLLLKFLWVLIFAAVAFALVLLCPSKMTWGFYLFALNLILIFGPGAHGLPSVPSSLPVGGLVAYGIAAGIIAPAGLAGFLIFCVRFPTNAPTGWRRVVENLAPFLAAPFVAYFMFVNAESLRFQFGRPEWSNYVEGGFVLATFVVGIIALARTYFEARGSERQRTLWILLALAGAGVIWFGAELLISLPAISIFVLGVAAVLITYSGSRDLERHRIKWVIFGFLCTLLATAVDFLLGGLSQHTAWYTRAFEMLYVVLPLTVAYAVMRHRVIDVRFALSRTLVAGVFVSAVILLVVGIDWLFTTRLPASRFEAFVYAGLALLVGFWLNAARQSMGKMIDFLLFRQWYRAKEQATAIVDAMRYASSSGDIYEPLTAGLADAFSLASVALFERVEDGGFVRVAARGWPSGTIWHILPDDPVALRAGNNARIVDIGEMQQHEPDVPAGAARPSVMLLIVSNKRVAAVLLCGSHRVGTALDRDELQTIQRACADAGIIYGRHPSLERHREPLSVRP